MRRVNNRKYSTISALLSGCMLILTICILTIFMLGGRENPDTAYSVKSKPKPWTNLNFYNNTDNFQFAIVSDRTGGCRRGVFPEAVEKINLLMPEFVMCVGDLIPGQTKDTEKLKREWRELNAYVKKFNMPFFYVSGNHDISNKESAELWDKLYGRSYYCFIYRNVLFMCLNTQETLNYAYNGSDASPHLSDKQIAWARKTLKEHPNVHWTCIFMHQPLWIYDKESATPNTGFKKIEKALKNRDYTVFAGHVHQYTKYVRNGKKYIVFATTGGGGNVGRLRGASFGEFDEVAWITMTDEGPVIANLSLDGIHSEDVMTEKKLQTIVKNAAFFESISFSLDKEKSSNGALFFSLPLKNTFKKELKYNLTWKTPQFIWETNPGNVRGVIKPGKEKILRFEALSGKEANIPAVCEIEFHVENELDKKIELNTRQLIVRTMQPAAEAVYAKGKPRIDGKLDDRAWEENGKVIPFFTKYGKTASVKTLASLTYDKSNLYAAFKCFEPNIKEIRNNVKKHDGPVWTDDSVEIFIDSNNDKKSYYQIIMNPSGVIYDSASDNGEKRYEINPEIGAMINKDSWNIEIAIPWRKLNMKPPVKGQKIGLLLVRTRTQNEGIMQYPVTFGDNHQPGSFGNMKFK